MFSERCLKVVFVSMCVLSAACTRTSSVQPPAVPSLVPLLTWPTEWEYLQEIGMAECYDLLATVGDKGTPTAVQVSKEPGIPA